MILIISVFERAQSSAQLIRKRLHLSPKVHKLPILFNYQLLAHHAFGPGVEVLLVHSRTPDSIGAHGGFFVRDIV